MGWVDRVCGECREGGMRVEGCSSPIPVDRVGVLIGWVC